MAENEHEHENENEMAIRHATDADVLTCARIDAENFHFILEPQRIKLLRRALAWQGVLVAMVGNALAGYAIFDPDWFDSTFLKLIVVDKRFRRRGIAERLIERIENKHCPSGRFFSSTEEDNAASRALHQKLGFVESGYLANLPQPQHEVFYFKNVSARR